MSTNSIAPEPDYPNSNLNIQQDVGGDRNQIIGQAVSSTIVNVTGGGQVTIYQSQLERSQQPEIQSSTSGIGPNPYKGLLAFQETDGNRFFGREKQIEQLWQTFRQLHEEGASIRLLPIYGPSGSGKSSLARAGLVPEFARRPLAGRGQAQVAVLLPGSHPLEALATVLARAVTNDPSPAEKSEEFERVLKKVSDNNTYEGLRRIADLLPEIASSPLIVLVDQFEEMYTLCENLAERSAFVGNLVCAAADPSKRVSVIVTLRSDFLGETQKHPLLNRLFSEQGFLVPAMDQEELQQVIQKPAELAGHPLDEATVSLLIEQTEGREGALPLLQFALSRIWEGLIEGVAPAVTLERIGGVGGALAGEAERVYNSLTSEEQAIVRRVFLGLVQLGEGTRDTRRRVAVNTLVSHRDDLNRVKQVMERLTEPGVRLITCSASSDGAETAEVTHEALFDHWQLLIQWLDQSRDDLRFQRRLEDAAQYWDQNGRPEGNLWRSPDLDLLKSYYQQSSDDMTPLQVEFFQASRRLESNHKWLRQLGLGGLVAGFVLTTGLAVFAMHQLQQAKRQRVEQLAATAAVLLSNQPVDAVINAIAAVGLSQSPFVRFPNYSLPTSALGSLLGFIQTGREQNLLSHGTIVLSAAFSPDGQTIITGGTDSTLRLWDASTGKLIGQPLQGHRAEIISVSFSPDGKTIVSGSGDHTLRLWDASTGKPIGQPLQGHQSKISSVTFSPDGKTIVSGSWDKTMRLWNASTGKPIGQPLQGHEDTVSSVAFSPDGKTIVSGSWDKTMRLWDVSTGKPIGQPLQGHEDTVSSVAFSPDGKTMITGSGDHTVRLWNASTGKPIGQRLQGHERAVSSVAFSPDGETIVTGSQDKTVRLWNASTGKPIGQPLQGHEDWVSSVGFSPDGKTIVSSSRDGTVRLWNPATDYLTRQVIQAHTAQLNSVALSPDGRTIVSGSSDKTIWLWNVSTGRPIGQPLQGHMAEIISVSFSPDGKTIVSGSSDKTIRLWSVSTGQPVQPPLRGHEARINSVSFSPDGKMIVSGSRDKTIRLWSVSTGQPVQPPLRGHEDKITSVAFSPDGKMIVSGSSDKTVRLWNISTGKRVGQPLQGHEDWVSSVAFSPDGQTIVTGSGDKTVRLWNANTGQPVRQPLRGHDELVSSVAFSPDGKMIASGSWDKTVRLWNASTGKPIGQPLRGHQDKITSIKFSPDSKMIVSASSDKTIRVWPASWEMLLHAICGDIRYHPSLIEPETNIAGEAKQTCSRYVWNK